MKEPQLSGIAKALAAQGRKGDTELLHVSKDELAALRKHGAALGINLTTNPATGLPEAFNWGGMLGSVGLPLLLTVATGGAAAPWMLAAAGAAGGAGGTMLGGGSTDEALMSGLMGGIGGYGMGGLGESLAQAGTEKLAEEAVAKTAEEGIKTGVQSGVEQGASSTLQNLGQQGLTQAAQTTSSLLPQTGTALAEGMTPAAGSVVGGSFVPAAAPLQSVPQAQTALMGKGLESVTASPSAFGNFAMNNAKNIGMAGIGALGAGASMNSQEQSINLEPESTENPYTVEWYTEPGTGQQRTRAVRRAAGGPMFSDYDAADAEYDGGYAPGGVASYASGGLGDLGSYSDGGRLLRGPGDGVSDNIPATIEGKRPARLADGEFVIPARAVSELGNGSTEAGSKQLYKMLDRIAAKRKSGKGLAYESNPKKMLPA